jgi:hypothetical protein
MIDVAVKSMRLPFAIRSFPVLTAQTGICRGFHRQDHEALFWKILSLISTNSAASFSNSRISLTRIFRLEGSADN